MSIRLMNAVESYVFVGIARRSSSRAQARSARPLLLLTTNIVRLPVGES